MSVDFRVRDFAYPVGILRLKHFFEKSQWFPPEELRSYQEERLRGVIHQAYYHVPYYRQLLDEHRLKPQDIRRIEDLRKLPLLSREAVRKSFRKLRADNANRFHPALSSTTGTTGTPLKFLVDRPANVLEFVYYWRFWSWAGYHLGDCFADVRWDYFVWRPEFTERRTCFQPHLRRLLLNAMRISREQIGEYASALRKYRPKFIRGRPSNLYCLALFLEERGMDDIKFQAAFTGGEVVLPELREKIESVFGCKVLDSYGHMEKCMAVSQCPEGSYHIHSEYGILQLADERKGNDGTRMGNVVCTSLHKMAMPFLRYHIEDVLELHDDGKRCPCGRSLPLVKAIYGRVRPLIATPEGRPITTLAAPFNRLKGIRAFQFVHDKPGQLLIRIVKGPAYTPGTEETLKLQTAKYIGEGMEVALEYVSESDLERDDMGMVQMVVSHVKTDLGCRPADLTTSRT